MKSFPYTIQLALSYPCSDRIKELKSKCTLIAKAPSIAPTAEKAQQEAQKLWLWTLLTTPKKSGFNNFRINDKEIQAEPWRQKIKGYHSLSSQVVLAVILGWSVLVVECRLILSSAPVCLERFVLSTSQIPRHMHPKDDLNRVCNSNVLDCVNEPIWKLQLL